jgi:LPS export ABC transporter protein LptC
MHRVVRLLSRFLPIAIAVFVGIAAWNYWSRTREQSTAEASPAAPLPNEVAGVMEGFTFTRTEGGKDRFNIRAKQLLGYKDESSILRGVEVVVFAQKPGDSDHTIYGDECRYNDQTKQMNCVGDVTVGLEPGTTAQTQELHYDSKTGVISSSVMTSLERPGEMRGSSGRMDYHVDAGLLRLAEGTHIQLTNGGSLKGGVAVFQKDEAWATVSQNVEVTSLNGWIRGGSARAELRPGTYEPRVVTVDANASAETNTSGSRFALRSNWLQGRFADSGVLEHVLARGSVRAENETSASDSGENRQNPSGVLTGPEVEAWLESDGRVSAVEARQRPEFTSSQGTLNAERVIRMDQRAGFLRSEGLSTFRSSRGVLNAENSIRMDQKSGSLRTEGASTLTSDDVRIEGRDFSLEEGDIRVFETRSRATLSSSTLVATGDATTARINASTNKIVSLEQTGRVAVEDIEGKRNGKGGKLTVTGSGDRIEIEGETPEVWDDQGKLNAARIVLDRKTGTFVGERNVRMTDSRNGGTTVVYAGRVEGSEARVEYTRGVQLIQDTGKVNAERLVVFPKEKRFESSGSVRSQADEFDITANRLELTQTSDGGQRARYSGKVVARKTDRKGEMVLESEALDVHFRDGKAETLIASIGVSFSHGARTGFGERLEYSGATGDAVLSGSESRQAEVRQPGDFLKGCSIQILAGGDASVRPCEGGGVIWSQRIKK